MPSLSSSATTPVVVQSTNANASASSSSTNLAVSPRKNTRFPLNRPAIPEHLLPRSKQSQSEDVAHRRWRKPSTPRGSVDKLPTVSERTPLLRDRDFRNSSTSRHPPSDEVNPHPKSPKKPFYRARPLWLVPFAIAASLVRGMTLAPRVEIYTQLACFSLHGKGHEHNPAFLAGIHVDAVKWDSASAISLYSSLDPLGPYLFASSTLNDSTPIFPRPIELPATPHNKHHNSSTTNDDSANPDPRRPPSSRCLTDPAVQAKAARLQTILTTTMGFLSALTTGWWGHFGERYGRTKVLAIATFGLFWTDLVFILASTPNLPFPLSLFSYRSEFNHASRLLLLAPIVEGLLGGWSTLQSATSAYISDCTSPGSRAQIFSRFTGVFYLGFSAGPAIAAWIIRHPGLLRVPSSSDTPPGQGLGRKPAAETQTVSAVFWIAVVCSFINFLLVLFVFPESLNQEKREKAKRAYALALGHDTGKGKEKALDFAVTGVEDVEGVGIGAIVDVEELSSPLVSSYSKSFARDHSRFPTSNTRASTSRDPTPRDGLLMRFLRPLSIFLPVYVDMPTRNALTVKRKKDWSLTLLAAGLFAWMLSSGVYQIKYLYANNTYVWGAEKLSYYISFMGGARAIFLLVLLPYLIATFKKRKPQAQVSTSTAKGKGKARAQSLHDDDDEEEDGYEEHEDLEASDVPAQGKKPAPTRLELGKAIRFDLRLSRFSLLIDIIGNLVVAIAPAPTLSAHTPLSDSLSGKGRAHKPQWAMSSSESQRMFIFASTLNSFASGMVPAVHSLALCIVQARTLAPNYGLPGEDHHDEDDYQEHQERDEESVGPSAAPVDTGTLFGAFAVLQAVGQMILGPMLFGVVYSSTLASHPKTIFIVAAGLMMFSLVLVLIVKNPVGEVRLARREKKFRKRMEAGYGAFGVPFAGPSGSGFRYIGGGKRKAKGANWEQDIETRGRSRRSKDLRGGAVPWAYNRQEGERDLNGQYQQQVARSI
ncbi:hypothetical protein FA15DRAFT_673617 [Coprinopsis marcescibilis]|uniref:MFS general substrate transporter n=1 Tax=Coprinopsis marcescibilis TaxID=230819 RepID=A0A5C3KK65_COPMA|nr:hypothetical protein FA15DRAFT_673617 [Coprinopsis marcescibilis]